MRDLLTTYASVLEEQGARNTFEREGAISDDLKAELGRLRPRAARQGLPVLADDLRGFKLGRPADPARSPRPAPRAAPAAPAPLPPRPARLAAGAVRVAPARPRSLPANRLPAWRTPPRECETRGMASSTRSRRPARKRAAASTAKKAPARKPAPRKRAPVKKQAPPLVTPRQAADLAGLLLAAVATFGVLVLWFGWDGAFLGSLLDGAMRDLIGRVAIMVPPLAALGAALLFSHGTRPRLRPVLAGLGLITLALLIVLSDDRGEASVARDHGGILGAALHGAVFSATGEPGVLVLGFFGLAGGVLLITGASVAAVTARLHTEVVETARAVRAVCPSASRFPRRGSRRRAPPRGGPRPPSRPASRRP